MQRKYLRLLLNTSVMKKISWADMDEEERLEDEKRKVYVPPHKKESRTLPKIETISEKTKLPHTPDCKKL